MFVIIAGSGEYRFGDDTFQVKAGDVLGAPAGGPESAHKLTNTGSEVLKYLSISSKSDLDVCEYPDSGKFMVSRRRNSEKPFRFIGHEQDQINTCALKISMRPSVIPSLARNLNLSLKSEMSRFRFAPLNITPCFYRT